MDKFDNNLRITIENGKICSEEIDFKNQKCFCAKCNNCTSVSNKNLKVKVDDGKILTKEVVLKKQEGGVIYGVVLFENGKPAEGAIAILSLINKYNGKSTPISFMYTDENGVFIFGINDTRYDYLINIVYNQKL